MVAEDTDDAIWLKAPIQADGAVDVVGDDFELQNSRYPMMG